MKRSHLLAGVAAVALALPAVVHADQTRITRLGNPATRFSEPLNDADDLRVTLRATRLKDDVAAVLAEMGWSGDAADLDRAAAVAEIDDVSFAPGTVLPFMAARKKGEPRVLRDVVWAGSEPMAAWAFEFSSKCTRYRLVAPKACGNLWIEELGEDPACRPGVVVKIEGGVTDACVTAPVDYAIAVANAAPDAKITVYVDGREMVNDRLTGGRFDFTFPGVSTPGVYQIEAVSGDVSAKTSVRVVECLPNCGITAGPLPVRAGKPFGVDLSGSDVSPGVSVGLESARVDVVGPDGGVVDSFEMGEGLSRDDLVIRRSGIHTLRAVVTDAAYQTSTNACSAQVDVQGGLPLFVAGYFGKERLRHDDADDHGEVVPFSEFARCSPLGGLSVGIHPELGDNARFEAALGVKIGFDDDAHTALFADAAVNRVLSRGFLGGGVSWWDIGKDSAGVGLLLQGGFDLDTYGKWQLVGQTRVPFFNRFDDVDDNYQFWAGLRFRPNSWR